MSKPAKISLQNILLTFHTGVKSDLRPSLFVELLLGASPLLTSWLLRGVLMHGTVMFSGSYVQYPASSPTSHNPPALLRETQWWYHKSKTGYVMKTKFYLKLLAYWWVGGWEAKYKPPVCDTTGEDCLLSVCPNWRGLPLFPLCDSTWEDFPYFQSQCVRTGEDCLYFLSPCPN